MASFDDLVIPGFLIVTPEVAERRRRAWAERSSHPVSTIDPRAAEREAATEKRKLAEKEQERVWAEAKKKRKEAELGAAEHQEAATAQATSATPGAVWSATQNKWVAPRRMSRANYERILRELPTKKHRKLFEQQYGPGAVIPEAAPVAEAQPAAEAPITAKAKRASPPPAAERKRGSTPKGAQLDIVLGLLTRPEGASLEEIGERMGWLKHSASAFLTGIRKTKTIERAVEDKRGSVYRITEDGK